MKGSFRTAKWVPPRNTIGDCEPEDAALHRQSRFPKLVISSSGPNLALKRKQGADLAQAARNEAVVTQRFLTKPRPVGLSRTGSKTARAPHLALAHPRARAYTTSTSSAHDPKNSKSRGHGKDARVASDSPLVAAGAKHIVVPESPTTSHANRQLPGFHETHVCRETMHTVAADSVEANSVVPATPVDLSKRSNVRNDNGRISPVVSQLRLPGRAENLNCKAYGRNPASRQIIISDKSATEGASKPRPSELFCTSRFESHGDSQQQRRKLGRRMLEIECQGRVTSARGKKRARLERPVSSTSLLQRQRQVDRFVPSPPGEHSCVLLPSSSLEHEEAGNGRAVDEEACLGAENTRPPTGHRQAIQDNSRERRCMDGPEEAGCSGDEERVPVSCGGGPDGQATHPERPGDLPRAVDDNREESGTARNEPIANGSPLTVATGSASVVDDSAAAAVNLQVGLGSSCSSGWKASGSEGLLPESPSFTEGKEREKHPGRGSSHPSSSRSSSSSSSSSSSVKGCVNDGCVRTSIVDAPACASASFGVDSDATPSRTTTPLKIKGLEDKASASGAISTRTSPSPTTPVVERCPELCQDVHPSPEGFGRSPPERRFTLEHQRMFKGASGGRGRMGKARGRGRGGHASSASRNLRRKPRVPIPAQRALVGVWRTDQSDKGKSSSKWYIALDGQKLFGKEAFRVAQMDRMKLASAKECRVIDRSTIMRRTSEASLGEASFHDDALKLSTFGVPQQLVDSYARRGVRRLYPWQAHCLRVDNGKPLSGGNLVYSAPTSGGKTLVAELLLLRALLQHNGTMALLVVPFIALATEKRDYLRDVWAPLELSVEAFHGAQGGESTMDGVNVAVCTIEKANSIVNRLAEETRLEACFAAARELNFHGKGVQAERPEFFTHACRALFPGDGELDIRIRDLLGV